MYNFIIKVVSFSVIVFGIHLFLDSIISHGLRKNKSNMYEVWNKIYDDEVNSNVIINGSSIAEVQISPKIIDTILNVNSYNFGLSSFGFPMQNARYKVYSKNTEKNPKMIIQIVGDGTFSEFTVLFQTEQFFPYLNDSIISNETKNYKGLDYFDYILPFKRYSAKFKTTFKGIGSFIGYEFLKSNRQKGYSPNDFAWDNKFEDFKKVNHNGSKRKINPKYVNLLDKYVEKQLANIYIVIYLIITYFLDLICSN